MTVPYRVGVFGRASVRGVAGPERRPRRQARPALAAAVVGVAALIVGCGSSSPSGSGPASSASATPAVCTQATAFTAALRQLADVNVVQQGTTAVKAAASNVQTQFQALSQSASTQFKPQVDALKSALDNLQTVLTSLGSQPNPANLAGQVTSALTQVSRATQDLLTALSSVCSNGLLTTVPTPTANPS